jgi:DNA-3-methyladenine glycosylase II
MADERLAPILANRSIPTLSPSQNSAFESLSRSIVGQQLATGAARAIWERCRSILPRWTPGRLLETPVSALKSSGLSQAKVRTLYGLATYFESAGRPRRFSTLSDDEIRSSLTEVWGVGDWTVDMFLMFHLGREDVFPVGDGAIQRAMIELYGAQAASTRSQRERIAVGWSPHRTRACMVLWSWLDAGT